jgi:predicted permease
VSGVLSGFALLATVVAVGYLVGRFSVLGEGADTVLARLAFFVATPALLYTTLADADLEVVFSAPALVPLLCSTVLALVYVLVARLVWRRPGAEVTIGALAASYVNAGNLGIPIMVFTTGSAAAVAPVMLFQLLVMAPVALTMLDVLTGRITGTRLTVLTTPLRNPVVLASLLGLVAAAVEVDPPAFVRAPLEMVGAVAVPVMLLAFGISLRGAPLPGRGEVTRTLWLAVALRLGLGPALAYTLAAGVFRLEGVALLTPVVLASLPTAQNVFVYAMTYGRSTGLARESILVTTLGSVPLVVAAGALLGR